MLPLLDDTLKYRQHITKHTLESTQKTTKTRLHYIEKNNKNIISANSLLVTYPPGITTSPMTRGRTKQAFINYCQAVSTQENTNKTAKSI